MSGMALASIPCVTCVIGLDVRYGCSSVPCVACVIGLDVRHGFVSVPCLAHVIGLDVRNGSGEHSVCSSRDGARC